MELGIDIKKLKDFKWQNFFKYFFRFFAKQINLYMFLIALLVTSYCVYLWYSSIYKSAWSDSRKQAYIQNKEKGIVFDRVQFEKAVAQYENRKKESEKNISTEDIFRIKK